MEDKILVFEVRKKLLIISAIVIVIFLAAGIIGHMLMWGGSLVFKVNAPSYVVDKVRSAEKSVGNVDLTEADFNALLELQIKNIDLPEGIEIEGMYSKLVEDKLSLYLPLRYHGLKVLISMSGILTFEEGNVLYNPEFIQIGKLSLPKDFLLKKLSSYSMAGFKVKEDNTIELSKDLLPFSIKTLSLSDGKISMTLDEIQPTESTAEAPGSEENTESSPTKNVNSRVNLLKRAQRQLSSVYGAVTSQAGKNIIGQIQTVVGKMVANPAYSHDAEAARVKAQYNGLSPEERSAIKDAILMNMDTGTLRELSTTFGL